MNQPTYTSTEHGHEVPVVRRQPNGDRYLPDSTKVRDTNLPTRLLPGHVVTPEQLEGVGGVSIDQVRSLIADARADVLAHVNEMLHDLPQGSSAYIHEQSDPVAAVLVTHNLGRRAVAVSAYSPDYQTQYEFFEVTPQNDNQCTIAFDTPLAFVALIS